MTGSFYHNTVVYLQLTIEVIKCEILYYMNGSQWFLKKIEMEIMLVIMGGGGCFNYQIYLF